MDADSENNDDVVVDENVADDDKYYHNVGHGGTDNLRNYTKDKKRVMHELEKDVEELEKRANTLQKSYGNERSNLSKMRKRCGWDEDSQARSLSSKIGEAIKNILSAPPYNRCGSNRLKLEISSAIMDKNFLNGKIYNELMK